MDTQSLMTKYPCESYTFHQPGKSHPKKHPGHPILTTLPGWAQHQKLTAKNVPKKSCHLQKPPTAKKSRPFFCQLFSYVPFTSAGYSGNRERLQPLPWWWIMEVPNHWTWDKLGLPVLGFLSRVIWVTQTWILRWISQICNIYVHFIVGATLKPRDAFFVSVLKILFQDLTICKLAEYLMPVEINTLGTTLFVRILFTWCFNNTAKGTERFWKRKSSDTASVLHAWLNAGDPWVTAWHRTHDDWKDWA